MPNSRFRIRSVVALALVLALPSLATAQVWKSTAAERTLDSMFGTSGKIRKVPIAEATAFANLPADTNGTLRYCSDCTRASPCAGGGTGALAARENGAWNCGVGGSSISGLTTNTVPKATSATTIGDSRLSDNGTDIVLSSGRFRAPATQLIGFGRAGDDNTGFGASTLSNLYFYAGGEKAFMDAGRFTLDSAIALSWRNGQPSAGAPDLFLYYDAPAVLRQGANSATPIAQTFKGPDGSGTDIVGGSLTIAGGKSTGTGIGGDVVVQTSPSGTTGAALNALGDRSRALAKYTTLTEAAATAFARVAVASGTVVGGEVVVTVEANDGTDFQARTLRFGFSAVNKAGVTTAGIDTPSESVAVSLGTLTCTITAVDATNNVDLKANCTSSLTQTVLRANAIVAAKNFGTGAISAQ